jgi:hypothetical protein
MGVATEKDDLFGDENYTQPTEDPIYGIQEKEEQENVHIGTGNYFQGIFKFFSHSAFFNVLNTTSKKK